MPRTSFVALSLVALALATAPVPAQSPRGIFTHEADVGTVTHAGATRYDATRQEYEISGSGQNMWGTRDDFHFVYKRLTGNFILSTRARFLGAGTDPHRKAGWSIRANLNPDAPHVTAAMHGDGMVSLQTRRTAGTNTEQFKSDSLADVIQLERRDGRFIMTVANFGDTLHTTVLEGDVALPDTVYVGLYVCAHRDSIVERAVFSNVRITVPAAANFRPYQDYLGSHLEEMDVESGHRRIIHSYRGSFQAPQYTPDAKALIYAQDGLLYKFDIASRTPTVIPTGFANRNNNDHVLSRDGRWMGISHFSASDSGRSIIFIIPAEGGEPRRVTPVGASYLHDWSPDNQWMVYAGQRNGEFNVYKIRTDGTQETQLTTTPNVDDGPEFTPDGRWIYFNSARTGRMQIWKMRPDGTEQTQVTNDGFNNWFPHISPDGRWIAYIAFPPDIPANDHPFYKHVLIRVMPIDGGPSRVVAYVYGGQGTINVPSWSPDGRTIAFVSNTGM